MPPPDPIGRKLSSSQPAPADADDRLRARACVSAWIGFAVRCLRRTMPNAAVQSRDSIVVMSTAWIEIVREHSGYHGCQSFLLVFWMLLVHCLWGFRARSRE